MPLVNDPSMESVIQGFESVFSRRPTLVSQAPGRLEILGNHTDYNQGTVLSVAVDRVMRIAAAPNPDAQDGMVCRLYDLNSKSTRQFRLDDLESRKRGDWANYIKGLIVDMNLRGYKVPAFDAVLSGGVPLSAGMSSSAALEMGMLKILDRLADARIGWLEMAKIGQACENNYVGANTGLMDQLSSLKGVKGQLIHSDFRSFEVGNIPMPEGTVFVVANSMVKHNLTNEYNERREACEDAARTLGVPALRDVTPAMLEAAKEKLNPNSYRRAAHVVGEIRRVKEGADALNRGDLAAFGALMTESHESSRTNFENSCPEVDMLVEIGRTLPGFLGARISGGGFGGITVHLVRREAADSYMEALAAEFEKRSGVKSQVMICQAYDGACVEAL